MQLGLVTTVAALLPFLTLYLLLRLSEEQNAGLMFNLKPVGFKIAKSRNDGQAFQRG
ncbi:MAG: hypothetical protein ACFB4I_13445 [Cyanophyceae cyanobacterium]